MANGKRTKSVAVPIELVPHIEKMKTDFYAQLDEAIDGARQNLSRQVIQEFEGGQKDAGPTID